MNSKKSKKKTKQQTFFNNKGQTTEGKQSKIENTFNSNLFYF